MPVVGPSTSAAQVWSIIEIWHEHSPRIVWLNGNLPKEPKVLIADIGAAKISLSPFVYFTCSKWDSKDNTRQVINFYKTPLFFKEKLPCAYV
jgi:hypothetical protein